MGTPEAQRKREALVGPGNDTTLAASALGSLFAYGHIDQDQYDAGLEYRRLRCILYGAPWSNMPDSTPATDEHYADIKRRFERKCARLTEYQREVVGNTCIFDWRPNWFFCLRLHLKMLPEDLEEQAALLDGLTALAGTSSQRQAA
jgi:hypothetical protein